MKLRCLAIDDEPLALRQISSYISKTAELELVATFSNAIDAHRFLETVSIDLLFVDINMPDLSGTDFVRVLPTPAPMVIFTTAYAEYAIEGFRLDAIDYLLKPFSLADFRHAVRKAASLFELRSMRTETTNDNNSDDLAENENTLNKEYIQVRADHKTSLIKVANIVFIESEGEYIRLHLADGSKLVTLFRLKNMESSLPQDSFMRVHRSYIVNLKYITGYTKGRVFLEGDEYVPIGEMYRDDFAKFIAKQI